MTQHHDSLSTGPIVGIVLGALAAFALVGALWYFIGRSRTYSQLYKTQQRNSLGPSEPPYTPSMSTFSADAHNEWKYVAGPRRAMSASPVLHDASSPGYPPHYYEHPDGEDDARPAYNGNRGAQREPMASRQPSELSSDEFAARARVAPVEMG